MTIEELLKETVDRGASDLHLVAGVPPVVRKDGELVFLVDFGVLSPQVCEALVFSLIDEDRKNIFLNNKELDMSIAYQAGGRFRVNLFFQKGTVAASLRYIPVAVRLISELGLPNICYEVAKLRQGFVLITGPTGHGKSTTLAAIVNEIVTNRSVNVITIEDPIEFVFTSPRSLISQREINSDTYSWTSALRAVLREDPDVVLIGEMRDFETISAALTIAETGHLVLSTLHTNSAAQTVDRIIDVFPEESKNQARIQLSTTLEVVISQRLLPRVTTGRVAVTEVMVASPAIKTTIREGKTHMIDNIIQTSGFLGMNTLESALAKLVDLGEITLETAKNFSSRQEEVIRLMKKS